MSQGLIGAGILICGPLYMAMVFVAAIVAGAALARDLAIATAGFAYLSYAAQYPPANVTYSAVTHYLSIFAGIAAGVALLVGV